jgi:hypothetical protein
MKDQKARLPLVVLSVISLLFAMWAGLNRLGWSLDPIWQGSPQTHGPLMVSGFLGTLIGVERAVALSLFSGSRWLYAGPIMSGLGGLLLAVGVPGVAGPLLIALGSASLAIMFLALAKRYRALFMGAMLLGAIAWLAGNLVWLSGRPVSQAVWWWAGFLVLTIAGERLELSRIRRLTRFQSYLFLVIMLALLAGLLISLTRYSAGVRLTGASLLFLSFWLLRNDVARRTARQPGLPGFVGITLLTGYSWLAIAGILAIRFAGSTAGPLYDAIIHAIFLGFVMVMIFAHAPIIFPSVLGRPIAFTRLFYGHLALLHISLLLRVAGDLTGWLTGRQWGGLLNVLVILLFLANTVRSARLAPDIAAT